MVHSLLVAAVVLFVLWIIGLTGAWAAHTAWVLFVIACALFVAWLVLGAGASFFGRGKTSV